MSREIILDTETTGIDPAQGHRMVEVGCIEMVGGVRTGKFFHSYFNPERDMPHEAERVHGLSLAFLLDKPIFAEKVDELLEFLGDATLVIHNAAFDMKFVNAELARLGFPAIPELRVIDTLAIARKKFPGSPANLDALCKRFAVDAAARTKHGALLDAELLSEVYIELMGGRQAVLALEAASQPAVQSEETAGRKALPTRSFPPSEEELSAHQTLLDKLKNPLWAA